MNEEEIEKLKQEIVILNKRIDKLEQKLEEHERKGHTVTRL